MKKLLAFLAGIIIIAIILFMLFGGFGLGKGSGSGEGESGVSTSQELDEVDEPAENAVKNDQRDEKKNVSDEGTVIEVSVVKSEYFYNNKSVELDDLIGIIGEIDGKVVVEVTDDDAALKPYNKLLDKLDELGIQYVECVAD